MRINKATLLFGLALPALIASFSTIGMDLPAKKDVVSPRIRLTGEIKLRHAKQKTVPTIGYADKKCRQAVNKFFGKKVLKKDQLCIPISIHLENLAENGKPFNWSSKAMPADMQEKLRSMAQNTYSSVDKARLELIILPKVFLTLTLPVYLLCSCPHSPIPVVNIFNLCELQLRFNSYKILMRKMSLIDNNCPIIFNKASKEVIDYNLNDIEPSNYDKVFEADKNRKDCIISLASAKASGKNLKPTRAMKQIMQDMLDERTYQLDLIRLQEDLTDIQREVLIEDVIAENSVMNIEMFEITNALGKNGLILESKLFIHHPNKGSKTIAPDVVKEIAGKSNCNIFSAIQHRSINGKKLNQAFINGPK